MTGIRKKLTSFRIILFGFAAIILLGTLLLMLPVSSRIGIWTDPMKALFTTTSAVCVTGLTVTDTGTYWSGFGQVIILLLIQTGGMGVVIVAASVAAFTGRRIGLVQRSTIQNAISAPQVGGIVRLLRFIVMLVMSAELAGACALAFSFIPEYGVLRGLWYSLFHSVSAFCNAGFDIFGNKGQGTSLIRYSTSIPVLVTIMILIVSGGLGFNTWYDLLHPQPSGRVRKLRTQSRMILITTAVLIIVPAIVLFAEMRGMPMKERVLSALFQSVTTRTAGFNSIDFGRLHQGGQGIMILLMLIGAAPGSTAGGMKVTTIVVLLFCAKSVFVREDEVHCMRHRIEMETVRYAITIACMYMVLFFVCGIVISELEGLPLHTCLFETASAIGTVGLTLGITSSLHTASRLILVFLMFFGRVGSLTLIYAIIPAISHNGAHYTPEKIMVG